MSGFKIYTKEKRMLAINKFLPSISFKRNEGCSPDCFRDDELFDETRDSIDVGYREYDYNDTLAVSKEKAPVDRKYLKTYGASIQPKNDIDTSGFVASRKYWCSEAEAAMEKYNSGWKYELNPFPKPRTQDEKLRDAAMLRGRNGYVFSKPLYHFLRVKHNEHPSARDYYSTRELVDICNACKLKNSNMTEFVDYDMFEEGLYWANRLKSNNNSEVKKVLRFSVRKDEEGNEYFDKEKNEMLKTMQVFDSAFKEEINKGVKG